MKAIYNLFRDSIEYPREGKLIRGLSSGVIYDYVTSTYVEGMINYLGKPIRVIHYEQYNNQQPGEPSYEYHFKARSMADNSLWVFERKDQGGNPVYYLAIYDWDVSDCSIGEFPEGTTLKEINKAIDTWLRTEKVYHSDEPTDRRYFEVDVTKIKGWLSF